MATYISLLRWTQQGVSQIKESPSRLDAYKELLKSAGGVHKGFYLVTGEYDAVTIWEAPSDEVAAKLLLQLASRGAVRTETMRAFPEEEYRKIIAAQP